MNKLAITKKGFKFLVIGLVIMILGFILLAGGNNDNPEFFNEKMFNFRRMVLAPTVIFIGIIVEIIAIMGLPKWSAKDSENKDENK